MSELMKGRASYCKTLLHIYIVQMVVLPEVRSALHAASQLPGVGWGALMSQMLLHLNQNPMMNDDDI